MAADEDLQFEYWLADRLSMTVKELRRMDQSEYVGWAAFHGLRGQQEFLARQRGRRG